MGLHSVEKLPKKSYFKYLGSGLPESAYFRVRSGSDPNFLPDPQFQPTDPPTGGNSKKIYVGKLSCNTAT